MKNNPINSLIWGDDHTVTKRGCFHKKRSTENQGVMTLTHNKTLTNWCSNFHSIPPVNLLFGTK